MSILKYKYQAHKLINYIFYIISFVIGFILGFTSKNIDINKLISNVLFIDNVSAYEITLSDNTVITEVDILNAASNTKQDFDFSLYPNVLCYSQITNGTFPCAFFQNETIPLLEPYNWTTGGWQHYTLSISTNNNTFNDMNFVLSCNSSFSSCTVHNGSSYWFYQPNSFSKQFLYSNFNFTNTNKLSQNELTTLNQYINKLDFDTSKLKFNENLFANNSDFKEVCVTTDDTFVISSNDYNNGGHVLADYIWFPYKLFGLKHGVYNTLDDSLIFDDELEQYFFDDTQSINSAFDIDNGLPFSLYHYSYENRFDYFGWSAIPFTIVYDDEKSPSLFPVYKFEFNDKILQIIYSEEGIPNIFGGSDLHFIRNYYDKQVGNEVYEFCFYINNRYNVQLLNEDDNGNYYGSISTPEGDINVYSLNNNSFFSKFNNNDYGLNTIITAPLKAIQRIGAGICSPINFQILGKDINMPCGNTVFWDRQDVQPFKVFWNMLSGGIICYGIGLSLYRFIHKLRNPLNDTIEVIDL